MIKFVIVSCTKKSKEEFDTTPLGQSLKKIYKLYNPNSVDDIIFYENKRGLCECYNEAIEKIILDKRGWYTPDTMIMFMHDDVYIEDSFIYEKLEKAFKTHDLIGVAGSSKWRLIHPTVWHNTNCLRSGTVPHLIDGKYRVSQFGEFYVDCIVLDGLFLSLKNKTLKKSGIRFDNRLKFHHYDIDFCLSAKKLGLKMTTAPLWLTHCSVGEWRNDPIWYESEKVIFEKWGK